MLWVVEKSQIQALDRSQPLLPMMPGVPGVPGVPEGRSHDYLRAGHHHPLRRAGRRERQSNRLAPPPTPHREIQDIPLQARLGGPGRPGGAPHLDNYTPHKTEPVRRWLPAHPHFHLHFTSTGSCRLNLVEGWFAELIRMKLQRSVRRSVPALESGIRAWFKDWNAGPRPLPGAQGRRADPRQPRQ